jgi:hypothetical protein
LRVRHRKGVNSGAVKSDKIGRAAVERDTELDPEVCHDCHSGRESGNSSPRVTELLPGRACQAGDWPPQTTHMKTNLQQLRGQAALRRIPFFIGLLLVLSAGFVLLMPSSTQSATAKRPSAWQLIDYAQTDCVSISGRYSDEPVYFGIYLQGRWNRTVNAGVSGAPSGSTSWGSYLPLRPGSSDGKYSLAYVVVQVPPDTPTGLYPVTLWADDGRTRQGVPVTIEVVDRCGQ